MSLANNMRLAGLKRAAAKVRERVGRAEAKAEALQRKFRTAQAGLQQAQSKYLHARKAAERAKRMALAAEAGVSDQLCAWEKTEKRLAHAIRNAGKAETGNAKRSLVDAPASRRLLRPPRGRTAPSAPRNSVPGLVGSPAAAAAVPPATPNPAA